VPLDKNEGVVKQHLARAVFSHRVSARDREGRRPWKAHGESLLGGTVPPTIDTA
jgi:hypothetical protein